MKDESKVTITILFILLIIILSIIPLTVNSDPVLISDFSLYDYKEKASINENHILYIENNGLESILLKDVEYIIVGDKENKTNFDRCVDLEIKVDGNIIKYIGKVKQWGVYNIDIQPIIKGFNLDGVNNIGSWWNSSFGMMKQLTIESDYFDSGLINYTVPVVSSNTTMLGKMDDGKSLRFLALDNVTEFEYEIEYFSDSVEMVVWVKIPRINSTPDTVFNMYYNNSGVSSTQDRVNAWDSGYIAVYHFNNLTDSKGVYTLVNDGCDASQDSIFGLTYKWESGNTDSMSNSNLLSTFPNAVSYECFVNLDTFTGSVQSLVRSENDHSEDVFSNAHKNTPDDFVVDAEYNSNGNQRIDTGITAVLDTWYFLGQTYLINTRQLGYVDSTEYDDVGDNTIGDIEDGSDYPFQLGKERAGANWLDGMIDELRVSNVRRNISWMKATASIDESDFITFGEEVLVPVCECIISNPVPINNSIDFDFYNTTKQNFTIDVNSSFGCTIDYINISLSNGTITVYSNFTDEVNGSFYINWTGLLNFSYSTEYNWSVVAICNGSVNSLIFFFTTVASDIDAKIDYIIWVLNTKMIGVDDELDINIGLDGTLLTLALFSIFFIVGYMVNKRSGGVLMLFSGFTFIALSLIVSTVLNTLLILPLMIPIGILIIILGVRKWLYPVEGEHTKSEGK